MHENNPTAQALYAILVTEKVMGDAIEVLQQHAKVVGYAAELEPVVTKWGSKRPNNLTPTLLKGLVTDAAAARKLADESLQDRLEQSLSDDSKREKRLRELQKKGRDRLSQIERMEWERLVRAGLYTPWI